MSSRKVRHVPFFVTVTFFFVLQLTFSPSALSQPSNKTVDRHIINGSYLVQDSNKVVASLNADKLFIPASIWKIATALWAIETLGPEFRFKTEFFQNDTGELYIRGYGDPFLISEEIDIISKIISKKLLSPITEIFIDQSSFNLDSDAHGSSNTFNPYDAGNFALSVNFNTINIKVTNTLKVSSAEPQTPTLPFMQAYAKAEGRGEHRINIGSHKRMASRYARELITAKLTCSSLLASSRQDIEREVPTDAKLIYTHYSSKTVLDIIEPMMLYSNNFIANQLFLTCGAEMIKYPAEWQNSKVAMDNFLKDIVGLKQEDYMVMEGSGLSRKNRVTSRAMLRILKLFSPYHNLLGKSANRRVKSGTLTGVYSLAGYFQKRMRLIPFVIMLNQPTNKREQIARELEKLVRY